MTRFWRHAAKDWVEVLVVDASVARAGLLADEHDRSLAAWRSLPLRTVPTSRFDAVLGLARRRRLTFYDAIYLELAKHAGATLATLDRALLQAAEAERVPIVGT